MKVAPLLLMCLLAAVATAAIHTSSSTHMNVPLGKHVALSGRRSLFLERRNATPHNLNVGGSVWPTSIFWSRVQVGTPAKTFAVAIDSGSNRLFLSGKNCSGCVTTPPNVPYEPQQSSTSRPINATFNYGYETCNPTHPLQTCYIRGPYFHDVVSLAGYGPAPIELGMITQQSSNFYQFQTIDGIMGMVGGPAEGNVFMTLCLSGNYSCAPTWAICFHEGKVSNGTMTIGGVDERLADGKITYVNSSSKYSWHEVQVNSVTFGTGAKRKVVPHSGNAILDTGTNNVLLPTELFATARSVICGSGPNVAHCEAFFNGTTCFNLTPEEYDAYPTVQFELDNGLVLEITNKDYLLKGSPAATSASEYCFGIGDGGGYFIFGDTIMQNYYLVFNRDSVGWGKVNKNNCGSL